MKNKAWKRPPTYGGIRNGASNRKVTRAFAVMAQGLAVTTTDIPVRERLKTVQRVLEYRTADKGKADIRFFINPVFDDFIALRDAMNDGEGEEIEECLTLLESDVKKLSDLIREGVAVTPWSDETNRHVLKFMQKVAVVREMFKHSEDVLRRALKRKEKAEIDLSGAKTASDRSRLERKVRRYTTYCASSDLAILTLEDILDELDELTDIAKKSPAMARRINSVVNLKKASDIYAHPLKAQQEREKIKEELYYIVRSLEKQNAQTEAWGAVLYGANAAKRFNDSDFT